MKVAVIGPGAMGCLFAARLANAGISTTLVDYKPERAARLNSTGITVQKDGETFTAKPKVASRAPETADLTIVLTKSYCTAKVHLPRTGAVLTIQNGLGNVEILCSLAGTQRVLGGATTEAVTQIGEGCVRHVASGVTSFGSWTSCPVGDAVELLRQAGFEIEPTEAPGQKIWGKAAINAGINPVTALLRIPNGRVLQIREAHLLMRELVVEAAKVAAMEGYRFDYSLVERAEEVCRQTAANHSSMLQDVEAGRPTEIDSISGEIIRRGELSSLPAPRTRVIWQLLKGMEQR